MVSVQVVRRVLTISGLDRLVSIYPSLEAAMPARPPALTLVAGTAGTGDRIPPARVGQPQVPALAAGAADGNGAAITPAVVWKLVDALQDGVALADGNGMIRLASTRLEEMFGYCRGELTGRPVECLIPAHLQEAHRSHGPATRRHPRSAFTAGSKGSPAPVPADVSR